MKSALFSALIVLFLSNTNQAQSPLNHSFENIITTACPFDPSNEVSWPEHWMIYQTLNGKWDGPIDSTKCISTEAGSFYTSILLDQVDQGQPVFIKSTEFVNAELPLLNNSVYSAIANFGIYPSEACEAGTSCENKFCTGLLTGINIPDSTGTGRALRLYTNSVEEATSGSEYCIVTEYFEDSFIEEFIIKISFDSTAQPAEEVRLYGAFFFSNELPVTFTQLVAPAYIYDGEAYSASIADYLSVPPYYSPGYLGLHDLTYPGDSNITFIEAFPEVSSPEPQTMNVFLYEWEPLHLQPFTAIRPGLVENSDSIRHILNIIMDEAFLCLNGLVELTFPNESAFIYRSGEIDFSGLEACFMFRNGGRLEVAAGSTLHYGNEGNGLLALTQKGKIILNSESQLIIDGKLGLLSFDRSEDNQVFVHLNKGASLLFDEHASLEKIGFQDVPIQLNVYMEGGTLDDSNLSASERQLINRIYPEVAPDILDNIKLLENPVSEEIRLSFISDDAKPVQLTLYTPDGRIAGHQRYSISKGYNTMSYPVAGLPAGLYILNVSSDKEQAAMKVLIH
jgi:hypothetical protein